MNFSSLFDAITVQGPDFGQLVINVLITFFGLRFVAGLITKTPISQRAPQAVVTDMFHWLLAPVFRMLSRLVVAGVVFAVAVLLQAEPGPEVFRGFGPMSRQPMVLMVVEVLLLQDFLSYWLHRVFHAVPWLWRVHAIHHSATEVSWSTTGRVHPVNEIANYMVGVLPCLLLGFPLSAVLMTVFPISLYAIAAHAAWDPPLGPLNHVIAGPRYHRWHHTTRDEGGEKNFGNVFSIWDRLFGTYYLPATRRPTDFGLDVDAVPPTYLGQLAFPFRPRADDAAEVVSERAPAPRRVRARRSRTSPSRA